MARKTSTLILLLALIVPAFASAQRFEITPLVGYRLGGELDELDLARASTSRTTTASASS